MQLPTWTWARSKHSPSAARRSMLGVVPGSLQPKAPIESALMSSTVMTSRFSFSAASLRIPPKPTSRQANTTHTLRIISKPSGKPASNQSRPIIPAPPRRCTSRLRPRPYAPHPEIPRGGTDHFPNHAFHPPRRIRKMVGVAKQQEDRERVPRCWPGDLLPFCCQDDARRRTVGGYWSSEE